MSINIKHIFFLGLMIGFSALQAQNNPLDGKDKLLLENDRIEDIIDSDKPFQKIPKDAAPQGEISQIKFESKDLYVETDFEPAPPTPKILQLPPPKELKNQFIKAGFGRYSTPLVQLYLHDGRDRAYDYGLDFSHLSAHKDAVQYRNFRENEGRFNLGYLTDQNKFTGELKIYNTSYFNYADTAARSSIQALEDTIGMGFTQIDFGASVLRNFDSDIPIDYDLGARVQIYTGRRNNRELHLVLTPEGDYEIGDGIEVGLTSNFTFTSGKIDSANQARLFVDFSPHLNYSSGDFALSAGLKMNYYNNNADSANVTSTTPQVELRYRLLPRELTVFAGLTGGMTYNRYYDLIRVNRFLSSAVEIKPSVETLNVYGGISGQLGNQADYNAQVSYKTVKDALVYMVPADGAYFTLGYDSLMKVLGIDVEVNYDLQENLRAGAKVVYNNYTTSTLLRNFHATPLKLEVYGSYIHEEKLTVTGELNVFGTTPMSNEGETILRRSSLFDLNLGADYRLNEQISLWLEFNNLLNANYQRWYNYAERPIDIKGGITVSF